MKKFISQRLLNTLIALSFTPSTYAHLSFDDNHFSGFYLGGSIGMTSTNSNQDLRGQIILDAPVGIGATFSPTISGINSLKTKNAAKSAVFFGGGSTYHRAYLGAELFVDHGHYENKGDVEINVPGVTGGALFNHNTQFHSRSKRSTFQFGLDLRPGFLISSESLLYARAGILYAKRKFSLDGADIGFSLSAGETWDTSLFDEDKEESKNKIAARAGVGLEQHICGYWNLRMDYIFTYYGKDTLFSLGSQTLEIPGDTITISGTNTYKVYNNTVMLGLSYALA